MYIHKSRLLLFVLIFFLSLLSTPVFAVSASQCTQVIALEINEFGDGTILEEGEVDCYVINLDAGLLPSGGVGENQIIFTAGLPGTQTTIFLNGVNKCSASFGNECRLTADAGQYTVVVEADGAYSFQSWLKTSVKETEKGEIIIDDPDPFAQGEDDIAEIRVETDDYGNETYYYYNKDGLLLGAQSLAPGASLIDENGQIDYLLLESINDSLEDNYNILEMGLDDWDFDPAKEMPMDRINQLLELILAYDRSNLEKLWKDVQGQEKFSLTTGRTKKDEIEAEKSKVMPYCERLLAIQTKVMDHFSFGLTNSQHPVNMVPGNSLAMGMDFSNRTYFSAHYMPPEWFSSSEYSQAMYVCSSLKREFFDLKGLLLSKIDYDYMPGWNTPYNGFTYTESAKIRAANNWFTNGMYWISDGIMSLGTKLVNYSDTLTPEWAQGMEGAEKNWNIYLRGNPQNPLNMIVPDFKSMAYNGLRFLGGAIEGAGGLIRLPGMIGNTIGASLYFPSMYTEEESGDTAAYLVEDFTVGLAANFINDPTRVGGQIAGAWLGLKGFGKLAKIKIRGGAAAEASEGSAIMTAEEAAAWKAYNLMEQRLTAEAASESAAIMTAEQSQAWAAYNLMEQRLAAEAVIENLRKVNGVQRTGPISLRHADKPVMQVEISKLKGHEIRDVRALLENAKHQHQLNPIEVIKVGDDLFVDDGMGRLGRAALKGESTVSHRVIRTYLDLDDLTYSPSEIAAHDLQLVQSAKPVDVAFLQNQLVENAPNLMSSVPRNTPVLSIPETQAWQAFNQLEQSMTGKSATSLDALIESEWHTNILQEHWTKHKSGVSKISKIDTPTSDYYAELAIKARHNPQSLIWEFEHNSPTFGWSPRIGFFDKDLRLFTIVDKTSNKIVSSIPFENVQTLETYLNKGSNIRNALRTQ